MHKNIYKIIVLISAFFILNTVVAYGQDVQLSDSSKALQFQITEDFVPSSFSGSILSYKWHVSADEARRLGVSLNADYLTRELNAPQRSDKTTNSSNINLSVVFSWMHYINPEAEVKFYFGYGPTLSYGYRKAQIEQENGTKQEVTTNRYAIGALGYAGVEWFFLDSMSLHAEYGASIRYRYTNSDHNTYESNTKGLHLGGDGVKFGISVYF